MEQSLVSQILIENALVPNSYTTATDGITIDSTTFQSLTFVAHVFDFTADVTLKVQHADVQAGPFVDTSDEDIIYPDNLKFDALGIKQFGYIGKKEFVRVNFVSGNAELGIYATKGHPKRVPTIGPRAEDQFPV